MQKKVFFAIYSNHYIPVKSYWLNPSIVVVMFHQLNPEEIRGSPPTGLHFGPQKDYITGHCSNKLDLKLSFVYYIIM